MDSVVVIVVSGEGGIKERQNNEAEPHYLWQPRKRKACAVIIDSAYAKVCVCMQLKRGCMKYVIFYGLNILDYQAG